MAVYWLPCIDLITDLSLKEICMHRAMRALSSVQSTRWESSVTRQSIWCKSAIDSVHHFFLFDVHGLLTTVTTPLRILEYAYKYDIL